jgi:hypothetical protein
LEYRVSTYRTTGQIDIQPPIPTSQIPADSIHLPGKKHPMADISFKIDHNPVTGQRLAVALVPAVDYDADLGNPAAEIQAIIDAHGTGRVFAGGLDIVDLEDEEHATSQITVNDGRAVWSDWQVPTS